MKLKFTGEIPQTGALPLPEGWPAADHDEPDKEIAKAKVKSGNYAPVESPPSASKKKDEPESPPSAPRGEG